MMKRDKTIKLTERVRNLTPAQYANGVHKVDVITWAFTLVKTEVFERMYDAEKYPFLHYGPVPTDSYFCQYCEDLSIDRWVSYDSVIAHGDVDPKHIWAFRRCWDSIHVAEGRFPRSSVETDNDELREGQMIEQLTQSGAFTQ